MSDRHIDPALLIHRPKKRRNYRVDPKTDQKSQNLKMLHQTLLCEEPSKSKFLVPDRSSAAQILSQSRNMPKKNGSQERQLKQKEERPVNFYINIEKLRNLKITNKDKDKKRNQSNSIMNPYLSRQKNQVERKSELLKNYGIGEKRKIANSSHQNINHQSFGRFSSQYNNSLIQKNLNKGKLRYKTHGDEESSQVALNKKPVFKRAHNEVILKDKTFIQGYLRGKQLGRGGFSKVWQGFHFKTKKFYAIKEIDTTNKYQTHLTEIWFGNYFFQNGEPKKQFQNHQGINSLLKMYSYSIVDPRAFIVFQTCNGSLGNMLYDIYEQDRDDDIAEDDKLYMIKYKSLYNQLRQSTAFMKTMLYEIVQALDLLAQNKIVHSDIKTENILIKSNQDTSSFSFKLIDYGSSFIFQSLKQYKLATPEYMCPELLNYILFQNKKPCRSEMLEYVRTYENTSAIDVWGLGCIIVELIHGLPLWLSNKTKILVNGKYETKRGLFAVSDRSFAKILQRQLNVVDNFDAFLRKQNNSGVMLDDTLKYILRRMLNPNPIERIRPHQIIKILSESSQK